jgi:tetratricopeptide (TPR) repeat protein
MMNSAFLYAGAIALAAFLAAAPAAATTATLAVIAEVQAALDKGDAQQAASVADGALKDGGVSQSERAGLLLYRGLAHELKGAHEEAMADFTAALQIRAMPAEEREQALLQRGFLLDGLGRLADAAADYTAVIALKGFSASTALNNRANIYRRQNRVVEARRDYLAALSQPGSRPQYSYYGLGQIAEGKGDKDGARALYEKAVTADPGYLLATDRLAALGKATQTSVVGPAPIVLHPPQIVAAPHAPVQTAPPRQDAGATGRIILRPPPSRGPKRQVTEALGLRPALDAGRTGAEVQLGAWRSQQEAEDGWKKAVARANGALDGLRRHIVVADLPGRGRYYRLRTSPATGGPAGLCAALAAAGQACIPARD